MNSALAIKCGKPVRTRLFPANNSIGKEEKEAAQRVLDSGILSLYLGCWHENFSGGPEVRALEKEWAKYFGVKHAIAVNSCTSGLYCAVGAIGTEPGDEIIVSPYSMTASAVAPLIYNAIPVFADIEEDYFCLDVRSIEERITPRTRAIIVVDILGLPYNAQAINALAKKHNLAVIEDAAQAPGATCQDKPAGTLGDIGVFSLNYHKQIHCGEGGVVVTNNDDYAERIQLIRNHAEAVAGPKGVKNLTNLLGFNFRLPEIESAITRCQLRKLKGFIEARRKNAAYLETRLRRIPALRPAKIREGCEHAYYGHVFKFNEEAAGVPRDVFLAAVRAELPCTELREKEGPLVLGGYMKPLYLQPLYQQKIAYGAKGYPWGENPVRYAKGICPVTERMYEKELLYHQLMTPFMTRKDLDDVADAFEKVWEGRASLRSAS